MGRVASGTPGSGPAGSVGWGLSTPVAWTLQARMLQSESLGDDGEGPASLPAPPPAAMPLPPSRGRASQQQQSPLVGTFIPTRPLCPPRSGPLPGLVPSPLSGRVFQPAWTLPGMVSARSDCAPCSSVPHQPRPVLRPAAYSVPLPLFPAGPPGLADSMLPSGGHRVRPALPGPPLAYPSPSGVIGARAGQCWGCVG